MDLDINITSIFKSFHFKSTDIFLLLSGYRVLCLDF